MHAQHRNFTDILMGNATQFIIPVFQREYRWREENCEQLWKDVVRVGSDPSLPEHFVGSVVYIGAADNAAGFNRWLLIDGQQRVTTLTLLLTALRDHIRETGWEGDENGPTWEMIDHYFLRNHHLKGDRLLKLHLRHHDDATLTSLVTGGARPDSPSVTVIENYDLFRKLLKEEDPQVIYNGINRLMLVDVRLDRGRDDPQLIFESLNSTGVDLSTSDLVRNFILMSLSEEDQTRLHTEYWSKIDTLFRDNDRVFANFIRDYLALRNRPAKLEKADRVYTAFRTEFSGIGQDLVKLESLLTDLLRRACQYAAFTIGSGTDDRSRAFTSLRHLGDVPAILIMRLLEARETHNSLSETELLEAVRLIESYMLRRALIGAQTKGYAIEFAKVAYRIDDQAPLASLRAALARMPAAYAFPTDADFERALTEGDLYHKRVCFHLLDGLENRDRKERSDTSGYSIEHVMPQNEKMPEPWRVMIGADWKAVHQTWLHRLGNLTLTGYNSTYSDRPLHEKQTIKNGFKQSSVRLNEDLRDVPVWTEAEMRARGEKLAHQALEIWPALNADTQMIRAMARAELKARAKRRDVDEVTMSKGARALFDLLRARIRSAFPEVIEMAEKRSVSYHDPEFFVELIPRAHGVGVLVGIDYNEVDSPDDLVQDTTAQTFVVNATYSGGVLINVRNPEQADCAMKVITQAHTLVSEG